nr:helix-turn-helix domain-containing protein [Bacilli bacterium]
MKEIGEKLKKAREEIGISLDEASTDLKIEKDQLKNLEEGKTDTFKDIINVKYLIRDYAKYLGLNKDDLVDDFNEYLFDYTSKISLNDIMEAKSKKEGKDTKVKSPYTTIKTKSKFNIVLVIVLLVIISAIATITIYSIKNTHKDNIISYVGR